VVTAVVGEPASGVAVARGAGATGFRPGPAVGTGFACRPVGAGVVAFRLVAALAGLADPALFAEPAAGALVLAADGPTAVVRARVTFGFAAAAGWSLVVVVVSSGSGDAVRSAMRLA
jgi:hypothetical protein